MMRLLQVWLSRFSLASTISVASALFGLVVACGTTTLAFWALLQQLDTRSISELEGKRNLLTHVLSELPSSHAINQNRHRFDDLFIGHDNLHLTLVDGFTNQPVATFSSAERISVTLTPGKTDNRASARIWSALGGQQFSVLKGESPMANSQLIRFELSFDRKHDAALLTSFIKAVLVSLPLLLIAVAAGAWLIARTALTPLRRFNRLAASIGTKSLAQRLSLAALPPELAELARDFNEMLDRIDEGYSRLEDFSGDLAHEMRTPVATMLVRTQVTLTHPRTTAELQSVLEGNVEELNRLALLISDMLFIASSDSRTNPVQYELLSLEKEAIQVVEYLYLIAEDKEISLEVTGEAKIMGDKILVQRAITNLISNAIRHALVRSKVTVAISAQGQNITLAVRNYGESIAPAHLARIFDRFYRVDSDRSRDSGGIGLGLAIVRSIMSAHGGQVEVRSHAHGETIFTLVFPAVEAAR